MNSAVNKTSDYGPTAAFYHEVSEQKEQRIITKKVKAMLAEEQELKRQIFDTV